MFNSYLYVNDVSILILSLYIVFISETVVLLELSGLLGGIKVQHKCG